MAAIVRTIGVGVSRFSTLMTFRDDLVANAFTQTIVEDEIFSKEFIFESLLLYRIGVMNDSTFEVKNILKPLVQKICRSFPRVCNRPKR